MTAFSDRLAEAVRRKDSCLVVGLDPVLERLPAALREQAGAVGGEPDRARVAEAFRLFQSRVIQLVEPFAVAVKPQIAFYERWGAAGVEAYESATDLARSAGLLVVGDVKRGDIGSTAGAYADGHLPRADAVTVNPYLGTDSVQPFLDRARATDTGLFVLVRTSNPSAAELQDLDCGGRPLHEHVAQLVDRWGAGMLGSCGYSSVGAVTGGTRPDHLGRLRALMPRAWFLVPGIGAQGGQAADLRPVFDAHGLGAVVNSSRGILYAYGAPDADGWEDAVAEAARTLRDELRQVARQVVT